MLLKFFSQKKKKNLCYSRSTLLKKYTNKSRATHKNSQILRRKIVTNNLISKKIRLITFSNKIDKIFPINYCEICCVHNIPHAIIVFKNERLAFFSVRLMKYKLLIVEDLFLCRGRLYKWVYVLWLVRKMIVLLSLV